MLEEPRLQIPFVYAAYTKHFRFTVLHAPDLPNPLGKAILGKALESQGHLMKGLTVPTSPSIAFFPSFSFSLSFPFFSILPLPGFSSAGSLGFFDCLVLFLLPRPCSGVESRLSHRLKETERQRGTHTPGDANPYQVMERAETNGDLSGLMRIQARSMLAEK